MNNERLLALSKLSIERDIVSNYQRYSYFKERVIDHFSISKTRSIHLLYKNTSLTFYNLFYLLL